MRVLYISLVVEKGKFYICPGQINGTTALVQGKFYLSKKKHISL